MSTAAQIVANQANAQKSTGPNTDQGKSTVAANGLKHGLTGIFRVQRWEDQEKFNQLHATLLADLHPADEIEKDLVDLMAQSRWLMKRAVKLQHLCFNPENPLCDAPKDLALYLRYQATHERAYFKALHEFQKLQETKRKLQIGFASQNTKQAAELRTVELHQARMQHLETRHAGQLLRNERLKSGLSNEDTEVSALLRELEFAAARNMGA